jgi:hypothetical protein
MSGGLLTGAGATFGIGSNDDTAFDADTYTLVGEIEAFEEFSRSRNPVEFASLADLRTRVGRGVEAVSILRFRYAHDADDNGQQAMVDAYEEASQALDNFNFRIRLADGATPEGGTTIYFRGPVLELTLMGIDNENVVRRQVAIARNSEWLEVPASGTTA